MSRESAEARAKAAEYKLMEYQLESVEVKVVAPVAVAFMKVTNAHYATT
jgi:hypothetical protein